MFEEEAFHIPTDRDIPQVVHSVPNTPQPDDLGITLCGDADTPLPDDICTPSHRCSDSWIIVDPMAAGPMSPGYQEGVTAHNRSIGSPRGPTVRSLDATSPAGQGDHQHDAYDNAIVIHVHTGVSDNSPARVATEKSLAPGPIIGELRIIGGEPMNVERMSHSSTQKTSRAATKGSASGRSQH